MAMETASIVTITVDEDYRSVFTTTEVPQTARGEMWLSEQQQCLNFRYRTSFSGYESDWHVAGDPTLIIVSTGCAEIELQDGTKKSFGPGDKFIARDFLPSSIEFDSGKHGHRARLVGDEDFSAVHIKLAKL